MQKAFYYSFIIPVYNRPQEIKELLESFLKLDFNENFEIVIIEDGSSETSEEIISRFRTKLHISYYKKENTGPGDSRNFGMKKAKGNYFIILDSDCIIPRHYLKTINNFLQNNYTDCFGGADAADIDFLPIQKAINYTMTSFLTTGGIRGSKKSVTKFEPRSFNMGISKEVFLKTKGFAKIHPGEDPDLSQRIIKAGFKTVFIPNAFVYHKRRISWEKYYIQVKKFGLVRPILNKWHPNASKLTFWFPSFFVVFNFVSVIGALIYDLITLTPLLIYIGIIFFDSAFKNKSLKIGFLSVYAVFIQFFGYGLAFLKSYYFIHLLKRVPEKQFSNLFFD